MADAAQAKGLAVEVDRDRGPLWLCRDPTRLRQALLNDAGNAVKLTERGRIRLCAERVEQTGTAPRVPFEVRGTPASASPP